MNREVLFKGKRIDNGEWIEGNLFIPDYPDKPTEICIGTNTVRITYDVIPQTVGQFIGRYDKNNKKIFNNDIVKTKYGRECVVVWFSSDKCNAWDLKPIGNYECKAPDKYDLWNPENLEVVGNIFDDKTNKAMENTPPREFEQLKLEGF